MNQPETRSSRATDVVAVLETDPTGHRLQYLQHLHDAVGADRCVVLTSEHARRSEEYRVHAGAITGRTVVLPGDDQEAPTLDDAVDAALAEGAGRLVIPDGDRHVLALVRLMMRRPRLRLDISLLLMRTTALRGPERLRPATLSKPALVQMLRAFPQVRVLFLTDALGVVRRRPGYPGVRSAKDPVLPVADPSPGRPPWFPPIGSRAVVGVFGVVTERKNVPLLVQAVALVASACLVVAGRLTPDVRAFLDGDDDAKALLAGGRMVVVDRMLEPSELSAALTWTDVVAVLHDNDSPSGILAEAALRGSPVLVPTGAWLERVVVETGFGVAVPLSPTGVAEGIDEVVRNRDAFVEAALRSAPRIGTVDFTTSLLGS